MFRKILMLLVASVVAAPILAASPDSSFTLPDNPEGACVKAYFDAYAGGVDAMREFSLKCVAEEALNRRPMDERLQVYNQMKQQIGDIHPRRLLKQDSTSMDILVEGDGNGWYTFSFMFQPVPPHKLLGIRIEMSDPSMAGELTTPMTQQEFTDSLKARLTMMTNEDKFSGVVLVARDGIMLFEEAYGMADKSFGIPNRLDTKFNLGSINKIFTKIAIGQLVYQGKLHFGDTLGSILPDYPNPDARNKVTVRQLLNMRSGIGDFFGKKFQQTPKTLFRSNDDFLPMFDSLALAFEPGSQQQYSNGGYVVLGAIIEKVSGQSYYDYVRQHIYAPCGMHNTDWYAADGVVKNVAQGYTHPNDSSGGYISNIYTRPARGSAAGGGYSTAEDLLKFTIAFDNNQLLPDNYTNWVITGAEPSPNQQSDDLESEPPRSIGIAGGAPGINADIEADFESGYTVIVLGNYDPPNASHVARFVKQWAERIEDK